MEIVSNSHQASMINVLIVEDQPVMQMFYRKVLAPVAERCFNVLFAPSVRKAIETLDFEESYGTGVAYAMLDWALPDGTIVPLFDHVKAKRYPLRCMLITGYNNRAMMEFAQKTGIVDAFIGKPISTAQVQKYWKKYVCPYSQFHHPDECCFETSCRLSASGDIRSGDPAVQIPSGYKFIRQ